MVSKGKSRLGFAGLGWIGRNRLEGLAGLDECEISALLEPDPRSLQAARALAPDAAAVSDYDALLALDLDGIIIATPSALHAAQARQALDAGKAVFCQKPLGRNADEVAAVVDAARHADRLLGVDLSYRFTRAMQAVQAHIASGAIGEVRLVEATFHNAYGPDKPWFYDRRQAGGGCLIDLGVHMVDLALWSLDWPQVDHVEASIQLAREAPPDTAVEDLVTASMHLPSGGIIRLACSWNLHAGQPAEIGLRIFGSAGGIEMTNINGSFYDLSVHALRGTERHVLLNRENDWGRRAIRSWFSRLNGGARFNPDAERVVEVARLLDRIYTAGGIGAAPEQQVA